jgi:ABC-type amino acid transport substrate-binding protein
MKNVSVKLISLVFALFFSVPGSAKILLRTTAQDSSPKYFKQGSEMHGYCADILRAIEEIDPGIRFVGDQAFLPFPRMLKKLEHGELDVFCGLQLTKEREGVFDYLGHPLILVRGKLVMRADDVVAPNALEEIVGIKGDNTVMTVKGTAAVTILKKVPKLKVDDSPVTIEQALKMLVGKRGRFILYQDMAIDEALKKLDIVNKVKIMQRSFYYDGLYMGASRKLNPDKAQRLKSAVDTLHSSGKLMQILAKYPVIRPENYPKVVP